MRERMRAKVLSKTKKFLIEEGGHDAKNIVINYNTATNIKGEYSSRVCSSFLASHRVSLRAGRSPASRAGLQTGDSIVAFGPVQAAEYKGVSESIVPLVKASVNRPIDVVVVRLGDGQVKHMALTLTPQQWSGAGLLGCILK